MTHDNRIEGACDQEDHLMIAPAAIISDVTFAESILFLSVHTFGSPQPFQDVYASEY
jgi:hypothetical protein